VQAPVLELLDARVVLRRPERADVAAGHRATAARLLFDQVDPLVLEPIFGGRRAQINLS
jgi:hypothetical protein